MERLETFHPIFMSMLEITGIAGYYMDFRKSKNKKMLRKTLIHNKREYFNQLNINERINLKSAYPLESGKLFEKLHLINLDFADMPYNNFCQR